ncbi:right-handed parallel beta-helix repeat-containing protein [Sphingomonas sp. KR3-1]|uniref:right-handed parallel beta-helix repeat-containing protein n=1 Tax=Sphingomonas sp. KR3-1 TaxID=3156611 RepID=UPI0032B52789
MNKLNRGRLLLSTCLSGVALAWTPTALAQTQDKDANWQPRAEVDARAANGNSQVSFDLFAPVAQNDSNLLFVAGRIGTDERYDRNGSVTIGGRGKIGEDVAIGVNAGVDFYKTDITSRDQTAVSFGLEGFTSVFDLHLNYRLPVNSRRAIGYLDPNSTAAGVVSVENNRLIERKSGWRLEEVPLAGANAELGARAPIAKDLSVRLSGAGFDYRDDAAAKSYRGVRGGLELDVEDPLGTGGRFSVGAELQNDNRWGTQARGIVRLSIPLGRGSHDRGSGSSGLDRQMGERLRRDYVTPSGTRYTDLTSTNFAIDARTGAAFGNVYFTSGAAVAAGAGTSASPTTLGDAVTRAGQNGIVVALGGAGNIASAGVTLATNQYLVGGASSVDVKHSDGSVTAFGFGGTNGTIVGSNAGGAAVTLGTGSVVRDVTVRGAGSGIAANGVGGFSLERVVIENTGGAGLTLTNTLGNVVVDGITIRGGAGAGLVVNAGSNVTIRNSTIGGGAGAIDINDAGGNLTTSLSNLTLSATGGNVLDIDGSGAGTVTVAGLSGINIAGGNGETGGFAARYVTFDSSTAVGIQAVNAGTMQVGTAAARVNGAGVSITESDGALTFGTLNVFNNGGTGLTVNNTKAGTFTLSNTTGTVNTTAGAALSLDPLLIDLNFTAVSSTGATGAGIVLDNVQGAGTGGNALNIGTLTITGVGQQGLWIYGGSTGLVTIGGGTITNSGGASVQIGQSGVAGSGGTIGLNFGAAISDSSAGPLVSIFNSGGAIRFTGAISGAGPITINDTLAGSSVNFLGATTITGSTSSAIALDNLAGTTTFTGLLTIANPVGTGIVIGTVPGGVTFGDVDITGLGAGVGANFTGTHGNVTFGTLDITGTGVAGSTGIDLTGATNAGAITIARSSIIQGVDIGVNLTNAAITGSFRYGDANAADGLQSRITANTVIVVAGMDATHGTYNFADVQLDGNTNNITGGSFTAYYVLAGASGAGTATDPGSIAGAAASGAQYIVLLNNPAGGQDVIDTTGLAGGALNLTAGQSLVSFLNTDFFAVTGATVPANLIVTNLGPTGIANTYAGSGAAILTSTVVGSATVRLANDTRIDGVVISNAVGNGIVGVGVSNAIIQNSNVSVSGAAVSINDGGAAASVTLTNLNLSASGGRVLTLSGAGAGTLNVSGTNINVTATGTASAVNVADVTVGTLNINAISTQTATSNAVQFTQVAGGTVNVGSITVQGTNAAPAGFGLVVGNSSATVNIGAVNISNTSAAAVTVTGNSGNVTLGPVTVVNSGGVGSTGGVNLSNNTGNVTLGAVSVDGSASNGVRISDNSGTVSLGQVTVNNVAGAGLLVANAAGNTTIAGASITGAANGVQVSNISGNVTVGATSIANSTGTGILINGVAGTVNFGATAIANSAGIVLGIGSTGRIAFGDTDITGLGANKTGVDARASEGIVSFATLDITGTSTTGTRGIDLTGAAYVGSLTVTESSTITGVGTGVDLTNARITGSFRYGDGSNSDVDGAHSIINAVTPIAIAGLNQTVGGYNFSDVALTGDTTNLATNPVTLFFVEQGRTGIGTKTDPGSLAAALTANATVIVLLNNPAGGNDTLDLGSTFTLDANQRIIGFLNGDTQTVGGGTPANLFLYGITPGTVTNPYAGSGAALFTNSGAGATITLSSGSSIDGLRIGGAGIGVSGIGVSGVSITNSIISGGTGAILLRDGGTAASATLSNLSLSATGGTVLNLLGTNGGTLSLSGSGLAIAATGNARGLAMDTVTLAGNLGFTTVSTLTSAGSGVSLANNIGSGGISFASINVAGTTSGSAVRVVGNSTAVSLGNVTVGGTTGVGSYGIEVGNNPGNVTLGTFNISNTGAGGLLVFGMPATFTAAGGTVTNSGTMGIGIGDVDGSVTFTGAVTITNPGTAGIAFNTGSTGTISFGDVDILGLAANKTGVDARLASGNITFATLDIAGTSTAGTRGIDLTGATFAGNLIVTGSSTITGVGTGVDLTNAAITGSFRFGDGSSTDANGAGSTISAVTPLIVAGLNALQGNYDFADVNLVGDTSSLATSATVYWVLAGASGAGTRTDPGSLAGAAASGADVIILVNNPAGGTDTLDAASAPGGTFTLIDGQSLRGFLNGDTISLPGGAPANVVLYNIAQGFVTNPFSGSGAPTLTNSSALGADTVTVTGNNLIDGVVIASNTGTGVVGVGASNVTIRNSIISGADSAIDFSDGGATASIALSNLRLWATNNSTVLAAYRTGAGSTTITQLSNITVEGGHGEGRGAYFAGAIFDSDPASAGYSNVDASLQLGSAATRVTGTGVDLTGATGSLNFSGLGIYNQGGSGLAAIGAGLNLTSTTGTIDTLNGTSLSLSNAQIDLVLASLVHAGTGNGVTSVNNLTGLGSGGRALQVAALNVTSGTSGIAISGDVFGGVGFGAGSSITGTTGPAITLASGVGALDFTYGGSVTQGANAALLDVANHHGTITFGAGSSLSATNGTGLQFTNADGTYAFNGTTTLNGGDAGIDIVGGSAGTFTFGAGVVITNPSGAAIDIANSTASVSYIGTVNQSIGAALTVSAHSAGTLNFSGATFNVTGGDGMSFDNADGTYSFGNATLSGGAQIGITNGSAGTFAFGSGTSITDAAGADLFVSNSTANVTYAGQINQSLAGLAALDLGTHSGGTIDFTGATFNVTGGTGLSFFDADGTYSFGDVALSGGARLTVLGGSAGAFTFGNVDITGLAANTTAVNLTGATGNVTFATLDITGASTAGTRGIDLTGSTTAGNVIVSGSSQIAGVGIGVDLTTAAITGNFRYGDGSNSDANGAASNITAVTPLVIAGLNGGTGTYNFADVNLNGDTTNLSVSAYFVLAGASGTGTRSDPGTLAGAEAAGATYIVLLNDPNGGNDILDATAGAGGSLDLAGGQSLFSFRDTDSFVVGGGAPANVLLFNVQTGVISNPFAGSGAPTLTASGANATVTLGGGNTIDGVIIANSGTGAGVLGNGAAAPIIIRNSAISGGAAGAIRIYDNAANVGLALSNLTLAANGGNILNLDGSGTGTFTVSQLSNLTVVHTTETGGFVFNDLTFDSDTVAAGLQAVSAGALTLGTTGARITGTGLSLTNVFGTLNFTDLNIANDAGTGLIVANSKANNFVLGTTGGAIDTTGGTAINLDPLTINMVLGSVSSTGGAYGVLLDQVEGSFTVTGAVNVSGATTAAIAIRDNTAQTDAMDAHFQGAVTISNTAGAGVSLTNNAGATVDFAGGLGITTTTGAGFTATGGGAFSVTGSSNTITTGNAGALALSGVTVAAGGATFDQITSAPTAANAVRVFDVNLAGALNFGGLDIDASNAAVSINNLTGTGGVNMTGVLDIDSVIGFSLSGTLGTINIANTAGSSLTIYGGGEGIRLANATSGTVNVATAGGSAAINGTSGSAVAIYSSTGSTLNYGGTIGLSAGSVLTVGGGTAAVTLSGAINSTSSGTAFNFADADGSYTISGAVTQSNGPGVIVNTASSGDITFSNASKVFSTGANTAISMGGTGTLSFTGGGLDIDTTTGTGFSTTAGTIAVTGSGNTITVGNAIALNLAGIMVGGAGVTFDGITAAPTAATALIVANDTMTGALNIGGLRVTGTGAAALFNNISGSGGINLTGTIDIDGGAGLQFSGGLGTINVANVAGSVLTIDGTSRAIRFTGVTSGTVNVASSAGTASIGATASSTSAAITATGGAGTLNYGGTIAASSGSVLAVSNSTGGITLAGAITATSAATAFIFADADGSYTISGTVTQSNGAGVAIDAASSGAVTFSGASKKFSTGINTAVSMGGTGTLSFTGGGLDIDTTSATGLSATAGALVVLGASNTIDTTTGQILNLSGVTGGTGGINFASLTATGTVANNGIVLSNLTGATFNGGTVNIAGTSGGANDGILVSTGTAAITFGATTIGTAGSHAIELLNSGSMVTFGTMALTGAGSSTVQIGGSTGPVTLGTGTITATGGANYAVSITGGTGDITVGSTLGGTRMVTINDHETGTVTFSGNMSSTVAGILITNVNSGLITFTGQTLALNATSGGVTMAGNSGGTIDFNMAAGGNGLDIVSTGTGFNAGSGGTVIVRGTGNSISTTGTGTALSLQNVTIGTNGFTFDSVSASGATTGILLNGVATTGPALSLGTVNLQAITSRGIDVIGILGAGLSITDLDIGLNSNSAVALNFNGTTINAPIIIGDFDVTNSGGAGTSIGVDLRGTLGGASILLGGQMGASSSISGVGTGIYLNASTNALFTYGDGESGIDTGSTISATTAIDATNAPTLGTYDFRDVAFSGSPGAGFGLNHIYFVDSDGGTGGGNGSGSDGSNPMTLAAAELIAAAQDMIILVNNGNAISAAGSNGNDSLVLASNVQVRGFGDGVGGGAGTGSAPINITLTVPSTILLSGGTSFNIADPTGNGAATLTSAAGANLITLGATGNHLSGFILDGGGAVSRGIKDNGAGATNTLLDYLTVRNFGTMGIEITPSTSTTIDHVSFSGNPGGDVLLNAANSVLTNIVSNGGGITLNNATGTTTLTNVNLTGGAGLVFTNATGTINATNVDVTNPLVAGLTISGGTAAFTFDSTSSVTKSGAGAALSIGGGHATGTFTYAGTLNITGGTGLQFDNADGTYNFTGNTTLAGGDAGIDILNGSGGSFVFGTNTTITSPTGTAFNVSGSTAAITYSGNITQANNAALVSFLNHSGGTVTFQTGTLSATNGTGLQFDNADATYAFNGTTTLNGGDAGVDILNGSGGTFTFASGASITSPTGTAFNVSGSTAAVTYNGSITQANNAALVNVLNHAGGTLTFQGGTLSASNGTGLQFNNADGTYNFNGTTTLNGGDAGVDIVNGSDGTFGFGSGAAITHAAAGDAFVLTDSNSNLTYAGTVSDANGYAVRIDNHDAGAVTFNGNSAISASGANALGLSVTNSNGGTVNFNGTTTLSTQANNAVTLSANAGGTVAFSSVGTALGITTTSGTAFVISGGGTINATGPNSTITTGSGTIFDISNAAAVTTTLGMTFASASNTLGANGILISRTAGTLTGSVTVNAGSITATTRGIDVDGGTLSLDYAGSVATSGTTARSVEVTNITSGAITMSGNLTDNALGINIANNTGGSINFYGQSITLNTVANVNAVTLASNTGANITFSSAAGGNGVDITASGTGNGIDFTGGGTLTVYSTGNSVQTATGQILNLVNGNVGSLGLVFDSLTSTGSTNGSAININNVDGTGTLSATAVSIAGTTGATADGIFYGGGSTMNVNLGTVTIANTGDEGIEINGTGNGTFTAGSVTINNTGGNGVEINNSNNTVSLNGGAIGASNDPTGFGVYVLNGTGTVSIASSITKTTGNSVVLVDNHETNNVTFSGAISATGGLNNGIVVQNVNSGTISFSGNATLTTGANTAVNLLNNTGGTITFPNGGLVITTTSGTGFNATGGGTVGTAGSGNRITSTTGTALNVVNTSIGSGGLRFQSISSNGASSGIILNNTGTFGGINVTGTGAAGSGGTIQNSSGDGISLTSTENVRLAYMNVTNNLGDGIGGSNINGFLIDNMLISGNGDDAGTDESGINLANLSGSASNGARPTGIFNSTIQNNNEFEVQITNSTGTLTNFQIVNSTFASNGVGINGNGTSPHGNLVNFLGTGTSSMGISVSGSFFTGNWNAASPPTVIVGSGLFIDSTGTSMTAQISGSTFTNTNNGINVSTGPGTTTLTYSIDGNNFTGTRSTAINDFQNGNAPFGRTVNGRITNNIIGNNAVTNSGSNNGNGISIANEGGVNANYLISGNTIQQIQTSQAIAVNVGLVGQATGNLTTNVTILNNTIRNINGSRGLLINNNQNTGGFPTVNVSVSGNSFTGIAGQAGNGQYMRFAATGGGTINITQGQATSSAIASELDDANGFNDTTKVSIGVGTFNYGQPAPTQPPASVPLP